MTAIIELLGGIRASVFAALALAASLLAVGQAVQIKQARATIATMQRDAATAQAKAERDAREKEYRLGVAQAAVSESYERGKSDAQTAADHAVADLRAGAVRLRAQWRGCEAGRVSDAAAAAREHDAAEQRRADSAGRIVRAAAACDAQVSALQALVRAERK